MFQKHKNLLVFIRSILDRKFPLILSVSATWAQAKACQRKKKKKKSRPGLIIWMPLPMSGHFPKTVFIFAKENS